MTTRSSIKHRGLLGFTFFSPFLDRFLSLLRRSLFAGLLVGLIWLPGLSSSALAAPEKSASQPVNSVEGDRISALLTCIPLQLSQPSFKRAWSEMGNDQLQRVFHLTTTPKLSQAETELASCLSREEFTNQSA